MDHDIHATRYSLVNAMHAAELVELAALVATQNRVLSTCSMSANDWMAEQFWAISKARLQHWASSIRSFQDDLHQCADRDMAKAWCTAEPIIEEVLLAEPATRIWCATLAILDAERHHGELDPIARSVYIGSLEARRRVLRLLVFGRSLTSVRTMQLNRLRRDCEYWTDLFLAQMTPSRIARQFAFDVDRIKDIVGDGRVPATTRRSSEQWSALLTMLRFYISAYERRPAVCPELNRHFCAYVLKCMPSWSFDTCGMLRSSWYQLPFASDHSSVNIVADLCGTNHVNRLTTHSKKRR
jgi:hypothetical protein